ncbi:MAG: hypothetical protein KGI00_03435 [Candidatus Micrarchaeota archaeon]|nr:hypothetical protein [Candidatus Micrarchaeota archaeon]MDE1849757.1 hypothetical protein [Candidatus Micrarchaeota archaeon]
MERVQNITRGVRVSEGQVTVIGAAERVTIVAERALKSGTFGVGALLIGRNGRVFAEAINSVIQNGIRVDPTGHCERQLVDWYFQNRAELKLPHPSELLIVSSLDPCNMCAGSILKGGFSAVAVVEEKRGGVHRDGVPHRMPRELWEIAENRLGLFSIHSHYEEFFSISGVSHKSEYLSFLDALALRCKEAIDESVKNVDLVVRKESEEQIQKKDIKALLREFEKELPLGIELPPSDLNTISGASKQMLTELLRDGRTCLVDGEGVPIIIARSAEDLSPIRNSVLEISRGYVSIRNSVYDNYGVFLPSHTTMSILKHMAPSTPLDGLLQLGSLGNFLGIEFKSKFALFTFLEGSEDQVRQWMSLFPPIYTDYERFSASLFR